MTRPVSARDPRAYRAEIERLTRLRTAITLDPTVQDRQPFFAAIDSLIELLRPLSQNSESDLTDVRKRSSSLRVGIVKRS
jgi:hypothetical protein